jgi:multisubunit Na+/H+ antiporter MnhF subunit
MNEWEIAALILGAAILPCLGLAFASRRATSALAALELAGTLLTSALMALCEGIHRQPFIELALLFAFLSVLGAMAFARLMERDL